jgi:hypothetical protein
MDHAAGVPPMAEDEPAAWHEAAAPPPADAERTFDGAAHECGLTLRAADWSYWAGDKGLGNVRFMWGKTLKAGPWARCVQAAKYSQSFICEQVSDVFRICSIFQQFQGGQASCRLHGAKCWCFVDCHELFEACGYELVHWFLSL